MPIVIKDFKWRQTLNSVTVQVPLNGTHPKKVDIFTSSQYIKASYSPYFFEALLLNPVKPHESKCTFVGNEIIFELIKQNGSHWENLELDLPRRDRNQLKAQLIQEEHEHFQKDCEKKLEQRAQLKKIAINEQISSDTKQRQRIEKIKKDEKEKALGDVNEWKDSISNPKISELPTSTDNDEKSDRVKRKPNRICVPKYNLKKAVTKAPMPLPRSAATVEVDFTERVLPTPCRESRLEEENEWLRKQAEVKRSVGFANEDLRPEEKNPQYLLAKGDEFLQAGNYLAAISAYSFGIKLSENFAELYVKRSEAHFAIGNMKRTIEDCSTAMDLMKPEVPANFLDRVTCIVRRGRALFKYGMKNQGFREIEIAYKMHPASEEIKQLLVDLMDELNNPADEEDETQD